MTKTDSRIESAILLAAGRGSRLSPYTDTKPKPLLPYRGQPTLETIIQSLTRSGVTRLLIVTNYLEEQIHEFINQRAANHPTDQTATQKIEIKTVHQQSLSGTANAVAEAMDANPGWFDKPFLVTATDYIVNVDFYSELVQFHRSHKSAISVSLKRLSANSQRMRSSVRISENMTISEIVEKPAPGTEPSPFTANLVFILPASISTSLKSISASIRGELEIQSAINLWLQHNDRANQQARGLLQATPLEWQPSMLEDGG